MKKKVMVLVVASFAVVAVAVMPARSNIGQMITMQPKLQETCVHTWENATTDTGDGAHLIPIQRCTNCGAEQVSVPRG